jgi:hypothetical protein
MAERSGWYVWWVKNPKPAFNVKLRWHSIIIFLTIIRFSNTFTINKSKEDFTKAMGRTVERWSLLIDKPKDKK